MESTPWDFTYFPNIQTTEVNLIGTANAKRKAVRKLYLEIEAMKYGTKPKAKTVEKKRIIKMPSKRKNSIFCSNPILDTRKQAISLKRSRMSLDFSNTILVEAKEDRSPKEQKNQHSTLFQTAFLKEKNQTFLTRFSYKYPIKKKNKSVSVKNLITKIEKETLLGKTIMTKLETQCAKTDAFFNNKSKARLDIPQQLVLEFEKILKQNIQTRYKKMERQILFRRSSNTHNTYLSENKDYASKENEGAYGILDYQGRLLQLKGTMRSEKEDLSKRKMVLDILNQTKAKKNKLNYDLDMKLKKWRER